MEIAQLKTTLDAAVAEHDFSGVIDVRQRGQVCYQRAAGYADRSNRLPNTLDTRFGIASGTKFFTALAIGTLIEAGKLALDTRLRDCISLDAPVFRHYAPEITLRHLLTHTSGIPDYYDEEQVQDFDNFTVAVPWSELRGPRDYLAVFPDAPMKFAPGARFSYSNGGYILLGIVIEELTGMRYRDYVAQAVFQPAGMARSGYFAFNRLPADTAWGYLEEEGGGWRTNIYALPIIGASDGGAYTTVADVAALWAAFWAGELLSPALVKTFSAPHVTAESEGPERYYGHGLWLRGSREQHDAGQLAVYFTGCDAGVSFYSSVQPGGDRTRALTFTVISNTTDGAWPLVRALRAAIE